VIPHQQIHHGSIEERAFMRTRSLFTALACTAVLAGASAESAFADSTATPTAAPSSAPTTDSRPATAAPSAVATPTTAGGAQTPAPPRLTPPKQQITAVPWGAPNTGVPSGTSDGNGEAEAAAAALVALLGGAGVVARRKLKGRV
jgi:hypothetical protein